MSLQALQVVHAHRVCASMVSPCNGPGLDASMCPRKSCTRLRGESGFSASWAGHISSQRPHDTQASSRSKSVRVNCSSLATPISPVSSTSSIVTGSICPKGRGDEARLNTAAMACANRQNGRAAINPKAIIE